MVDAEPVSWMRVVSNLVGNAIEHAPATKILVACRMRAGKVIIQVWDNGVGIRADVRDMAPMRGQKGPTSSGNGIGLSIVADECATTSITFDICSKDLKGTCVTLTIPGDTLRT